MFLISFGLFLLAVGLLWDVILDSIVFVPAAHYAVRERFKKLLPGTLEPGLTFKWPFIERIRSIHRRPRTLDAEVAFTTADGLHMIMKGPLQYKADPGISYPRDVKMDPALAGRNVFYHQSDAGIKSALLGEVESVIGSLGGKYDGERFIEFRGALFNYLNARLRLSDDADILKAHENTPAEEVLIAYDKERVKVERALAVETKYPEKRSHLEELYGIDIVSFSIKSLEFSEETRKALEKQRQAEFREKALSKTLKAGQDLKQTFKGSSDHHLADMADSIINDRPRRITSISGLEKGSVPLINLKEE